jgi:hypothetical protein
MMWTDLNNHTVQRKNSQLLINALTGQVGPITQDTGNPTNQELA